MTSCKAITDYFDLVLSRKYRVCHEQIWLLKHVKKCFETESIYVDEVQLEKYFDLQKYFEYELFPWEKFVFALHNCTYKAPGILRWPDLVLLVSRGTGKNGYMAFEDFVLTTPVNGIKYYDIDLCATSEEQAKRTFDDIIEVLENNKAKMEKHFSWNSTEIINKKTRSRIRYRTSNSDTKDGGRPGKVDYDEYHAYKNYKLIQVFKTGFGKKPMPRTTIATTMGDVRDGPLDQLLETMIEILKGKVDDNGLLPFICRINKKEQVHKEKYWYMANPSLQYFPELLREYRKEYREFKLDNFGNASFMTKRMNFVFGESEVPVTEWCYIKATNKEFIDLEGQNSVFGLDYMKTTDFLAVGLLFRVKEMVYWITHSLYCSNSRDLSRIHFPLNEAEEMGLITQIKDVEISPDIPCEWLYQMQRKYNIIGGGMDNYRYSLLKNPLKDIGFDCEKKGRNNLKLVRPSDIMQIAPVISSDFANQRIVWGDNPLMRWYTNNAKIVYDTKGNITYGKIEPKSRKTDGFMAFASAYTVEDMLKKQQTVSLKTFNEIQTFTF